MNIKGIVISSATDHYKIFECEVAIPSLKISLNNQDQAELLTYYAKSDYNHVAFLLNGNPFEVTIMKKEEVLYASAKEIAQLDLSLAPVLKENNLVKKFLGEVAEKSSKAKSLKNI